MSDIRIESSGVGLYITGSGSSGISIIGASTGHGIDISTGGAQFPQKTDYELETDRVLNKAW